MSSQAVATESTGKRGRKGAIDVPMPKVTSPAVVQAIKDGHLTTETKQVKLSAEKAADKKEHSGSYVRFVPKNSQGALALCGGKNETLSLVVAEYFNSKARNISMTKLRNESEGPEKAINSSALKLVGCGLEVHAIKLISEALSKSEDEAKAYLKTLVDAE